MAANQVIVIGGGLSGLSAAHTVLERGGSVLVIDKNPFLGGNSTKATSGINGALTRTQIELGIKDSPEIFMKDTTLSASKGKSDKPYSLAKVLTYGSAPAVEWLQDAFGLDLSLVSRLGGHSMPRTHRGKEKFPGMTITYALMEKLEEIEAQGNGLAKVLTKHRVEKLLTDASGEVIGVEYVNLSDNTRHSASGPVIIATGGFGADFTPNSILRTHRPDLAHLPTTNGDHCTGDGIKLSQAIGAATVDMECVQVHPTGMVHPDDPDAKVKWLAAEALRGVGGILLDRHGKRFCNELGRRDYVSGEMNSHDGPFTLVLNKAASEEIEWHCKHYVGRGLMKKLANGKELAAHIGCSADTIASTLQEYNQVAASKRCPFDKKFFHNTPLNFNEYFHVAQVTPVIHYTMGGLKLSDDARVCSETAPIPGLYATGEVCGGVHGLNRLGGSSLLDCVVFGRVAGDTVARDLLSKLKNASVGGAGAGALTANVSVDPSKKNVTVNISWDGEASSVSAAAPQAASAATQAAAPAKEAKEVVDTSNNKISAEEVAKHKTENDCWVIVNGQVLNVTEFLPDHPGGKKAILLYAGKDASEEFNMLHEANVVEKYAPDSIIGVAASGTDGWKFQSRL